MELGGWGQPASDLAARLHDAHVNGAVLIGLYWDAVHEDFTQWGRWGGSPVDARAVVAVCQYLADADFVMPVGDWVRGWVAVWWHCVVTLLLLGFLLVCGDTVVVGILVSVWWRCVVYDVTHVSVSLSQCHVPVSALGWLRG